MRHLTIRNLPEEVAEALKREKKSRGTSLNQTVIDLMAQALGVVTRKRSNGLARFAGTWSEEEFAAFEAAVADTRVIDEELWD